MTPTPEQRQAFKAALTKRSDRWKNPGAIFWPRFQIMVKFVHKHSDLYLFVSKDKEYFYGNYHKDFDINADHSEIWQVESMTGMQYQIKVLVKGSFLSCRIYYRTALHCIDPDQPIVEGEIECNESADSIYQMGVRLLELEHQGSETPGYLRG